MLKLGEITYPSLKGKVSQAEWDTRVELAAIHRLIQYFGWFDLTMPGAAAKVPGEDAYLFLPAGLMFDEITASSLVRVALDGELLGENAFDYVPGTWFAMRAMFEARPEIMWAMHSHDKYAMALSARREKLLPISQSAAYNLATGVSYHDYDGPETYPERMAGLGKSLGSNRMLILHNHGMVTVGQSAPEAFLRMYFLRYSCEVQLLAGRGDDLFQLSPDLMQAVRADLQKGASLGNPWPALIRKLDRIDPGYRD